MIEVDEKERIRGAYLLQRRSIRQIAREFHHARSTVRKAICAPSQTQYTRPMQMAKLVPGSLIAIIDLRLDDELSSPRKQALLELETAHRVENATKNRIQTARFPYLRALDQFDFSATPSLNKAKVLELSHGEYIRARENVIAIGNTGTGKTHLAISLGLLACQKGWNVRFYPGALLDRLTRKCHILEMNGEGYRFKESLRRREVTA